tara:strand:+ start:1834 stop:2010 length:177 start_codon:yes stop_codon:yes gene_type:complete
MIVRGEKQPNAKLKDDQVRQIRIDRKNGMKYHELAKKYKISISNAFKIVEREGWSHIK